MFAALVALLAALAGGLVVTASMTGWPSQIFRFTLPADEALPVGTDIAGWAHFDRDSYFIGEPIRYRARILYRRDRVVPNLDTFKRSLPFFPFEKGEGFEVRRRLDGGIGEYRLDFELHGVKLDPPRTYRLDPAVVFYQPKAGSNGQLKSIRIPTPAIHITEYYPRDISGVPLLALKGPIHDPARARQWLVGISGGIVLALALFLLWWYGRRRVAAELSTPERLWREFHGIDRAGLDARAYLLKCERIFSRLLQARTHTSPRALWAGDYPRDAFWRDAAARAHGGLRELYRSPSLSEVDVRRISDLLNLDEIFSAIVAEDRLHREQEPSRAARLARQPRILAASGLCLAVAAAMFALAARPALWLAGDVARYNQALAATSGGVPLIEDGALMLEAGNRIEDGAIKAAALYNAGTALAHLKESAATPLREMELFEVLFDDKLPLSAYLDTPEEAELFLKTEKWLRHAVRNLQEAARADRHDEDIRRNLELVIKRHGAVLGALKKLFEASRGTGTAKRGLKGVKVKESQRKAIVDVLNMKWPDKYRDDKGEGKKDKGYGVSEHY